MGAKQSKVSDQKLYDSYLTAKNDQLNCNGKVVAITGTSPGSIGEFIAKAAAVKDAGVIILLNRESGRSIKAEQSEFASVQPLQQSLFEFLCLTFMPISNYRCQGSRN